MKFKHIVLGFTIAIAYELPLNAQNLTPLESKDLESRILDFYSRSPRSMNQRIPKFSLKTQSFKTHHLLLRPKASFATSAPSNLKDIAGLKSTREFRNQSCSNSSNHFKISPCQKSSNIRNFIESSAENDSDDFRLIADTWVDESKLSPQLSDIPSEGKVSTHPWSDDYWRLSWGGTSYRVSSGKNFPTYEEAIASYDQPQDFHTAQQRSEDEFAAVISTWSPSEKYDTSVGDVEFDLTLEQKGEGAGERDDTGSVPAWIGICDGWAAAGIMTPAPVKAVDTLGIDQANVHWTPSDIRALTSLTWARGKFETNQIGSRCDIENPELYDNGRIKDSQCFDTNPATFHLSLGNMIGVGKKSMIIDASFDAEIWNQSLVSYEFTYFNPLNPKERDKDWTKVAVDYDATFKEQDRFQTPLTRGILNKMSGIKNDKKIQKIVGVIATITYVDEATPSADDSPPEELDTRVTYVYDLELSKSGKNLIPTGGEWHNNSHPDFLWVPRKDSIAWGEGDKALKYSIDQKPSKTITKTAKMLSSSGIPLCSVVETLVNKSAKKGKYPSCK